MHCRLSNILVVFFNLILLLFSFIFLLPSSFTHQSSNENHAKCVNFLQSPILSIGLFLLVVSLLGLVGSCCRVSFFLWFYSALTLLLIIGLMCFSIFAMVVINEGMGHAVEGTGFMEYRLGDYSHWLQDNVVNGENWDNIRSCLSDTQICQNLGQNITDPSQFTLETMPPLQSGCCKPPMYCGFKFVNATYWEVPSSGPLATDVDCTTWSNDQAILCLDCKSCKAGILTNLKTSWWTLTKINIVLFIILNIVYSVTCCAFENNQQAAYRYHRYPRYP